MLGRADALMHGRADARTHGCLDAQTHDARTHRTDALVRGRVFAADRTEVKSEMVKTCRPTGQSNAKPIA
eukprot:1506287-Alexandrium_andersonii.AAC.1